MNSRSDINRKVVRGVGWMVLLRAFKRGIGMISTIILARLLTPEDYGIVALAMSVYALLEMFAAFGVDFSLVQKAKLEKEDYHSAFTFQFIVYSTLALIFLSMSNLVADFYSEPRLVPIIHLLSFSMFLSGLTNIALVDFRRELQFDKEFKLTILSKAVGFVVTVSFAFYLRSYWALIIGSTVSKAFMLVLGYYFRPYMPKICFSKIAEIFSFSKWLLITNLSGFLKKQAPNVILGKVINSASVGIYSMGAELAQTLTQELTAAMNRPVYSGFAKFKQDMDELRRNFLDVLGLQAALILPLGFGVASVAELLVYIVLGEKWLALQTPLIYLSIGFTVSAISSVCIYLYMALGKSHLSFVTALIALLIFIPLIFLFIGDHGILGVAYALMISSIFAAIISYILVSRVAQLPFGRIVGVLARPYTAAILMLAMERLWLLPALGNQWHEIVRLPLCALAGAICYFVALYFLWFIQGKPDGAETKIMEMFQKKFVRRLAGTAP